VGDPFLANDHFTELLVMEDANPELCELGEALLQIAGHALGEQKKELVHLRGTLSSIKALLKEHAEKVDAFVNDNTGDDSDGEKAAGVGGRQPRRCGCSEPARKTAEVGPLVLLLGPL
jgi:hypothetical protein